MKSNATREFKIGIVIQYYELREDVPLLIEALGETCRVVLFAREEDLEKIDTPNEKRAIPPLPKTMGNKFWNLLYKIAGNIAGSKANYRNWSKRLISTQGERAWFEKIKLNILLEIRLIFANAFPFDSYLKKLKLNSITKTDDIDAFLAMSDVYDINFLGCMLKSAKPLFFYIYSWDHAAKHHKFSHNVTRYLTWHKGISQDLKELHKVDNSIITELGSTQLSLVTNFIDSQPKQTKLKSEPKVVYYGCTWGTESGMKQELRLIFWLSKTLNKVDSTAKLIIRPYPNARFFDLYRDLSNLENTQIENIDFRKNSVEFKKDSYMDKYRKIRQADVLVHSGSTIGLEAAYFETPVIHLAPIDFNYGLNRSSPNNITKIFQRRHLKKYMLASKTPNVVRKKKQLDSLLKAVLTNPQDFLDYNRELSGLMELKSIDKIARDFIATSEQFISK